MSTAPLVVTSQAELELQLEHPSADIVRSRANEVFGNVDKAHSWLNRARQIFGGRSPEQIIGQADEAGMRRVLESLIDIEFGNYS